MLCFTLQSRVRVGVGTERDFEGDSPAQLGVAGKVDLAHSTGTDESLDFVMSNDSTSHRDRRLLDEPASARVRVKETLHFRTHGILAAARGVQKGGPLRRIARERAVEELLDARPGVHR